MKPGFLAPSGTLDKKPPHGQPCNRCGLCCVATLCDLASHVFRGQKLPVGGHVRGPCPALLYDGEGLSVCGLVADPMRFAMRVTLAHGTKAASDAAKFLIGSGTGCDARVNGEKADESFYAALVEWDRKNKGAVRTAKKIWGVL